jgi:hypothetical protein
VILANHPHGGADVWHEFSHGVAQSFSPRRASRGLISAEQFLEMNEKVGGFDINSRFAPERMAGDPEGLRLAYATGRLDSGSGGLASIPIIDTRGYNDFNNDVHASVRSFVWRFCLDPRF